MVIWNMKINNPQVIKKATLWLIIPPLRHFAIQGQENTQNMQADLQALQVFSQHPKWFITPINP